jgi:hypothetical protein
MRSHPALESRPDDIIVARRPLANCDPRSSASNYPDGCDNPDALVPRNNGSADPNQNWYLLGIGRVAVDPDLKPQSSDEFSAGGEYEIIPGGRLGLTYIHRSARTVMEDMSRDEGSTYFVGNPGAGRSRLVFERRGVLVAARFR